MTAYEQKLLKENPNLYAPLIAMSVVGAEARRLALEGIATDTLSREDAESLLIRANRTEGLGMVATQFLPQAAWKPGSSLPR